MRVLFLQLSDIHIHSGYNPALHRIEEIVAAVRACDPLVDACFLTVTGDVADKGAEDEYALANRFFSELRSRLEGIRTGYRVEEIYIPGNHDCYLPDDDNIGVRDYLLKAVLDEPKADFRPIDGLIAQISAVQDNFFNFMTDRVGMTKLEGPRRLFYCPQFDVNGKLVVFHCYNTSWMSKRHEKGNELLIPLNLTPQQIGSDIIVVSLLHHPLGWLESNNHRAFRKELERLSDIIMVGHEHEGDQYLKRTFDGPALNYIEGGALQGRADHESAFNILLLDLDKAVYKVEQYAWRTDHYEQKNDSEWQRYERSNFMARGEFENAAEFSRSLNEIGAGFTHSQGDLHLDDVYVRPDFDLRTYSKANRSQVTLSFMSGEKIVDYVIEQEGVLITGADQSGKTSFAKSIYGDLQKRGIVPVLIEGSALKKLRSRDDLMRAVKEAVTVQYSADTVSRFNQLDPGRKALIIDNFHSAQLNNRAENAFADAASQDFGTIVILVSDSFQYHELIRRLDDSSVMTRFQHLEIREFGHVLRGRLIDKWFRLGIDMESDDKAIDHKINEADRLVSTLLGKNTLPAHPLFILTILQQYEANTNLETENGSLAFYYEYLIQTRLRNCQTEIIPDAIYMYTSILAYRMFEAKERSLREEIVDQVAREYQDKFKYVFSIDEMKRVLQESGFLYKDAEGRFRFKYRYIQYYFVAQYLVKALYLDSEGSGRIRAQISEMTRKVYVESNANILIFLVYLTHDRKIIEEVLNHARSLFHSHTPCDMSNDVSFLKTISADPLHFALPAGDANDRRLQQRQRLDVLAQQVNIKTDGEEDDLNEVGQLEEVLKFNVCYKTLQIMGQILRNAPGTLDGDTKLQIAAESYSLGLRALNALYHQVAGDIPEVREFLSWILLDQQSLHVETDDDRREMERRTDNFFVIVMVRTAFAFVKRISYAVGSEHLKETYKDISDVRCPLAIELINTSIEVDHYKHFPAVDIIRQYRRLDQEKEQFAQLVLQTMVRDHFYLFNSDRALVQRVCDSLKIELNSLAALTPARKKK